MKPITNNEFLTIVQAFRKLIGSRFQNSVEIDGRYVWTFWRADLGEVHWVLDLQGRTPMLLPALREQKPGKKSQKSPAGLFINAHFVGKHLLAAEWNQENGRVLNLEFTDEHCADLRLFRGGANLILQTRQKSIAWAKPHVLKPLEWQMEDRPGRSLQELMTEYWPSGEGKGAADGKAESNPEKIKANQIAKLNRAIEKTEIDLQEKLQAPWTEVALWLETHRSLKVEDQWQKFVDPNLSVRENIQACYQAGKDIKEKITRTQSRLQDLRQELATLQTTPANEISLGPQRQQQPNKKLAAQKFRGLNLSTGHQLLIGRSGKENLEILRSSQAWDLWLHLRDYPSAHAVLRKNKNENLNDATLRHAINAFIRENFRAKLNAKIGQGFDVIIAELRHVKPIKGDKLGRVTFSNERVLRHQLS